MKKKKKVHVVSAAMVSRRAASKRCLETHLERENSLLTT